MTGHDTGPPGRRSGPALNRPTPTPSPDLTKGRLDEASLTRRERVFVVLVWTGVLSWHRVFITEGSAWAYAARRWERGHEAVVMPATLLTERPRGRAA